MNVFECYNEFLELTNCDPGPNEIEWILEFLEAWLTVYPEGDLGRPFGGGRTFVIDKVCEFLQKKERQAYNAYQSMD